MIEIKNLNFIILGCINNIINKLESKLTIINGKGCNQI